MIRRERGRNNFSINCQWNAFLLMYCHWTNLVQSGHLAKTSSEHPLTFRDSWNFLPFKYHILQFQCTSHWQSDIATNHSNFNFNFKNTFHISHCTLGEYIREENSQCVAFKDKAAEKLLNPIFSTKYYEMWVTTPVLAHCAAAPLLVFCSGWKVRLYGHQTCRVSTDCV